MFRNWFQRRQVPGLNAANPGSGVWLRISRPDGTENPVNLAEALAKILRARGERVKEHDTWLELPGGLLLVPRLLEVRKKEEGGWQVSTTVEARQAGLFPAGVFEYQHTVEADPEAALERGFRQFVQLDLPVLIESRSGELRRCTAVDFNKANSPLGLPFSRRVVFGPILHWLDEERAAEAEAHPFCPCCFFTKTFETMKAKVRERDFIAIRFYAMRMDPGSISADCRVNGSDWEEGRLALLAYAATWPERGLEIRKQYLTIRTQE